MRTSAGEKRFLRCTNADPTRSGGRQPAVVRQTRLRRHQRDCSQDRRQYVGRTPLHLRAAIPRGAYAPRSCAAMRTSAGERRFFRCTNAHPAKSGGRQPAVVRQTRLRRHQRDCSQDRREYVRRSPLPSCAAIPRGAYAPRSCAAMRTSAGEKRFLRCTHAHPTKSGGRQPAVGCIAPRGQCTANNVGRVTIVQSRSGGRQPAVVRQTRLRRHQRDCSQDRREYVPRSPLPSCAAIPRGAYAPRSCAAMRTSAGEKTIFAMHRRTSDQERRVSARRGSTNTFTQTPARLLARPSRVCAPITLAIVCSDTTEAYAPRSWLRDVCSASKSAIRDAQTHIRPRAAGVSPPWVRIAPRGQCTASNVRRVTTVQSGAAGVSPPWVALRRANSARRITSGE
jgi:hypothetical protein